MDVQNKVILKAVVNEKEYMFVCDNDAPLGSAFDACHIFRGYIIEKINESAKEAEQKKESESPPDAQPEVDHGRCCGN